MDPNSGALTSLSGSPFIGATKPAVVVADPRNRFVFVGDAGSADFCEQVAA